MAAASAGAHAIGLNFVPESPRFVGTAERAGELIAQTAAPSSLRWAGVFANPTVQDLERAVEVAGLSIVQLHGEESASYVADLRKKLRPEVSIWKAFRVAQASDLERIAEDSACDAGLLDAKTDLRGGSGRTFDWDLLAKLDRRKTLVLAGGLNPDNVQEAVKRVAPTWVDVASGVESSPGVKDPFLIEKFVRNSRAG